MEYIIMYVLLSNSPFHQLRLHGGGRRSDVDLVGNSLVERQGRDVRSFKIKA